MRWRADGDKNIVGLISGTSYDGVNAVLVEVGGAGAATRWRLLAHEVFPFDNHLKERLSKIVSRERVSLKDLSQTDVLLGEVFARAVSDTAKKAHLATSDIALVASHGQTVCHTPVAESILGYEVASTMQIGSAAVIAERTGITTVYDFRSRDMAAGGQGAPLVPLADWLIFRSDTTGRICLNIGGIANITALSAGCSVDDIVAFDTGPGNSLMDIASFRLSGGAEFYDHCGYRAERGKINKKLLAELTEHPYFRKPPPKSTGREEFGESLFDWILSRAPGIAFDDLIATLTHLTAESVADALEKFVFPLARFEELLVSGGGLNNGYLIRILKERIHLRIRATEDFGVPAQAKEALAFALLGNETMAGFAGNVPSATGAKKSVVLGAIAPGRNFYD